MKYLVGRKSGRDDSQKDVLNGTYEVKDKKLPGNYFDISTNKQGLDNIKELVESCEAQDKEKLKNYSVNNLILEISHDKDSCNG